MSFGNETTIGDFNHEEYVAKEVEKMILSSAAIEYGQQAVYHFAGPKNENFAVDLRVYMDNLGEVIDLVPAEFTVSMLRQRDRDNRLMWTVSISRVRHPTELAAVTNSCAGKSRDRNYAALAAIIRLWVQDVKADIPEEPVAA